MEPNSPFESYEASNWWQNETNEKEDGQDCGAETNGLQEDPSRDLKLMPPRFVCCQALALMTFESYRVRQDGNPDLKELGVL
jgi:hypothetical protein